MADKPILVILPGWGGSHITWQEFITLASLHFSVRCIDLPCFGAEPCPPAVWGVEDYSNFIRKKISELRTPNSELTLLGHSFGGQVAVSLAAKHPEFIDKLILSGAAVVRPNRVVRRALSQGVAAVGKAMVRLPGLRRHQDIIKKVFYRLIDAPDYLETSGVKREIYKKIIRQDGTSLLPQIKTPTLVVWGARDRQTPLRHGRIIYSLLPRAQWCVFPHGRHGLHRELIDEYLEIIKQFALCSL